MHYINQTSVELGKSNQGGIVAEHWAKKRGWAEEPFCFWRHAVGENRHRTDSLLQEIRFKHLSQSGMGPQSWP